MEANKEAAHDCIQRGREALRAGDTERALRLFRKSSTLYPSTEIDGLIESIEKRKRTAAAAARSRPSPAAAAAASAGPAPSPALAYTVEQAELVKRINKTKSLYEVMGLEKNAESSTIGSAYRKLAVKLHPDKNGAPGADDAFKKMKAAYEVLNDAERRKRYDHIGDEEEPSSSGHGPSRYYASEQGEFTAEDVFNAFFFGGQGGMRRRQQPQHEAFFSSFAQAGVQQRQRQQQQGQQGQQGSLGSFVFLLPFLLILLMSFLNSPTTQEPFSLERSATYSVARTTKSAQFPYFVTASFASTHGRDYRAVQQIDSQVDTIHFKRLKEDCEKEKNESRHVMSEARKVRGADQAAQIKKANEFLMPSCDKINNFYARAA